MTRLLHNLSLVLCFRILIYSATDLTQPYEVTSLPLPPECAVLTLKQHCDNAFVALDTGSLLIYRRCNAGIEPEVISLGENPVSCLLPINLSMYAACGKHITVLNAITGELQVILKNDTADVPNVLTRKL